MLMSVKEYTWNHWYL